MEAIVLPVTFPGDLDLAALNARLRAGEAGLVWSAVEVAPADALATLLGGLDLSEHAEVLGLGTVPEWLGDALLAALDGAPAPAKAAHTAPGGDTPAVWTVPAEPEPPPVLDEPPTPVEGEPSRGEPAASPHLQPPTATELRAMLEEAVLRDLLGPANGPDEEIAEDSVRERYLVGLLAPRGEALAPEQSDDATTTEAGAEDGATDSAPSPGRSMYPSSFGLTFSVAAEARALRVTCRWGRYRRVYSERLKDPTSGNPKLVWQRAQVAGTAPAIPLREGPLERWIVDREQPDVSVTGMVRKVHGDWVVTLFLVNGQQERVRLRDAEWLFQPELIVEAPEGSPDGAVFRRRPYAHGEGPADVAGEEELLEMGYRDQVEFAVGHGVSVEVTVASDDPRRAVRVQTSVVPTYEVPRTTPPTADEVPALRGLVPDMRRLAELEAAELEGALAPLPEAYAGWLREQGERVEDPASGLQEYEAAARAALRNCEDALARIRAGIQLIAHDAQAARAFAFMNRAMWLQRTRSLFAEGVRQGKSPTLDELDLPKNRTWYPFQLAFILINLPSLTDLAHPDRAGGEASIADLLWFPTGGGKTEAYLGLTAYTLAVRRLQGAVAGRDGGNGVAVLMRYTLRLLTLQQFQRASALICACEVIRREARERGDRTWGETPFRIGLWVGQKNTPTYTSQSAAVVKELRGLSKPGGVGSPAVLTNCPWCGMRIDEQKHIAVETVGSGHGRTYIYCGDPLGTCPFSERQAPREGLPVLVVDEEIYRLLPALLIATVDKFAQLPWNGTTMMLFGRVTGYCPRHGFRSPELEDADHHPARNGLPATQTIPHPPLRPPDLIIQDELHLISGPLGTLVGLYETAVDGLACWEVDGRTVRPKVIASTATIRQAGEQVHSLFLRQVRVFPPQALDADDTFFARQRPPGEEYPGRRYMGICAPGRRLKAVLIRVYVAYLAGAQQLYKRYGAAVDPWMTLVGYFNSMRELGGMRRLVEDDVQARLRRAELRGLERRPSLVLQELTSRRSSSDIPALLDRLEQRFDPAQDAARKGSRGARTAVRPIDVLLATNMVSVGVDVKRLGLMVVSGQPKSTSEYIQATSRVGRSHPGLVCTVFNWTRPRDLSHYERFRHYHATFYRHVEALSVTPFAPRALDRGLAALLVALVRLRDRTFNDNEGAGRIERDHIRIKRTNGEEGSFGIMRV